MATSENRHAAAHRDVAELQDLLDLLQAARDMDDASVELYPGITDLALLGRELALADLQLDAEAARYCRSG